MNIFFLVVLILQNYIQRNKLHHSIWNMFTRYWEQKVLIFVDVLMKRLCMRYWDTTAVQSSVQGVYVTLGKHGFCLFLYLTWVHYRDKLQHGVDVSKQKIKFKPIRTEEVGAVALLGVLYVEVAQIWKWNQNIWWKVTSS